MPSLESAGNAANTFRPYDPSAVQGDSTPYLPAPKPKKKSFFKQLVAIVVAVVVAWVTQQWYLLNYAVPEVVATAAVVEGSTLTLSTTAAYAAADAAIAGALGGAAGAVGDSVGGLSGGVGSTVGSVGGAVGGLGGAVGGLLGGKR